MRWYGSGVLGGCRRDPGRRSCKGPVVPVGVNVPEEFLVLVDAVSSAE